MQDTLVESLAKLQLGYVDLFLVHTPLHFPEPGRLKAVWKEMEALMKEGIARSVGVSNFRTPQLREILDGAEIPPSVNQVGRQLRQPGAVRTLALAARREAPYSSLLSLSDGRLQASPHFIHFIQFRKGGGATLAQPQPQTSTEVGLPNRP
ncbi:NADP-dependent oxidoreductase domain-containing protein [Lactarius pseudohatsudake]|nr:NADP-dependent oxidoreductase domain-containing protein [Lactarius pseudohatsudake]